MGKLAFPFLMLFCNTVSLQSALIASLCTFPNATLHFSAVNLYKWEMLCTTTQLSLCHHYRKY